MATCVGEEGLDIGEVDLIVCFDAPKSPIRLVQRQGRTGRRRSGRIVVIVSEGKENQVYQRSQSSKNSIHRAIRDGCKKLDFYRHCLRMVPRHLKPQPYRMHMTVDEFEPGGNTKRKNKNPAGVKTVQSRFSAGGKRGAARGYLNEQELQCWSKELSLSDREFRAVEKSVEKCFSRDVPLLSLEKLKRKTGSGASPRHPGSLDTSYTHFPVSNSANTSGLGNRFSLSLSKWNHFQTAPLLTKVIGHSSASNVLTSCLEFGDLLHSTEGLGASYDLEMLTFLDRRDVKGGEASTSDDEGRGREQEIARGRRRHRRVFVDSSDDEDFVETSKHSKKDKTKSPENVDHNNTAEADDGTRHDLIGEDIGDDRTGPSCGEVSGEGSVVVSETRPPNRAPRSDVVFTASQHVVPKPPTADSFDWIDDLDPSQSSQPCQSSSRPSRPSQPSQQHQDGPNSPAIPDTEDTSDHGESRSGINPSTSEKEESCNLEGLTNCAGSKSDKTAFLTELDDPQDFVFITPKIPPGKRRSRIHHAACNAPDARTETLTRKSPPPALPVPTPTKSTARYSMDLFDDISTQDIFGDMSISASPLNGTSRSKCLGRVSSAKTSLRGSKEAGHSNRISLRSRKYVVGENAAMPIDIGDITVISESDPEEGQAAEGDDDDVMILSPIVLGTPQLPDGRKVADSAHVAGEEEEEEESYMLHCGRRKQRRINFLESPPNSDFQRQADSLHRKNVSSTGDEEVPVISRKKNCPAKRLVNRLSTSDDDDFVPPLRKRLNKSDKRTNLPNRHDECSDRVPLSSSSKQSLPNRKRACDFIEEEAELSQEDSMLCDDMDAQDSYNMDDSFINDNSMLTQYTPTHKPTRARTSAAAKSHDQVDMYKQSLISPKDKIFSKRKCDANRGKYRMAFSQRYHLLNHYMDKAGFRCDSESKKHGFRSRNGKNDRHELCSSGSEAEEMGVAYGEEDLEELSQSWEEDGEEGVAGEGSGAGFLTRDFDSEVQDSCRSKGPNVGVAVSCRGGIRNQRASPLSDSDIEEDISGHISPIGKERKHVSTSKPQGHTMPKALQLSRTLARLPDLQEATRPGGAQLSNIPEVTGPPVTRLPKATRASSLSGSGVAGPSSVSGTRLPGAPPIPRVPNNLLQHSKKGMRTVDMSKYKDIVISPSLLVSELTGIVYSPS